MNGKTLKRLTVSVLLTLTVVPLAGCPEREEPQPEESRYCDYEKFVRRDPNDCEIRITEQESRTEKEKPSDD